MKERLSDLHAIIPSLFFLGLVFYSSAVSAQSARNLGMGGVSLPDDTGSLSNPAYAASDFGEATVLPLPLGVISALPLFDFSTGIEVLALLEQGTHLGSLMLGLPELPTDVSLSIFEGGDGNLVATLTLAGGAPLQLDNTRLDYRRTLALPVDFDLGGVSLGVRPYTVLNARFSADEALLDFFGEGSHAGEGAASASAEAGLAFDLTFAEDFFPADPDLGLYLGTRVAPYLGFFRAEATGAAEAVAEIPSINQIAASYEYDFAYFVSDTLGYGIGGDLGLALRLGQIETGQFDLGLSLTGVGVGVWQGTTTTTSGSGSLEGASEETTLSSMPERRATVSPYASLVANSSFHFQLLPTTTLLLAGDTIYTAGRFLTHLGAEATFALGNGSELALRGGGGYEDGPRLGLGVGLEAAGIAYDLALHAQQAAFTRQPSYGIALSLTF